MAKEAKAEKAKDIAPAPKKKKFKLFMIIIALVLLLIGGGVGVYWYLNMRMPGASISSILPFGDSSTNVDPEPQASEKYPNIPPQVTSGSATLVSLPSLVVNLADSSANRYLKISMDIEVTSPTAAEEINKQSTRIRDSIILLLSSKTMEQLASAEGKLAVKNEIASRINQVLGSPRVLRVYFTEFVIS